jgi:hypothetical protein
LLRIATALRFLPSVYECGPTAACYALADYRTYTIGPDGNFIGAEMLSIAADDAAAIETARRLVGEDDVELWDRDRLVVRLKGKS